MGHDREAGGVVDQDGLHDLETKLLKRQVRRNRDRFPDDFMFALTSEELENWRCQFGTSNADKMDLRHPPMAFTEQGVAMQSTVLNSKRATHGNIQIMRAFTRLRQMLAGHEDLRRKIEDMESKYDEQFRLVFEAIRQLLATEKQPERKTGFVKEEKPGFGDAPLAQSGLHD